MAACAWAWAKTHSTTPRPASTRLWLLLLLRHRLLRAAMTEAGGGGKNSKGENIKSRDALRIPLGMP
jgi:hypothetical protein